MAEPTAYDDIIAENAARVGIPVDLFRRLIAQESSFNPNAVSPKGAGGLGQVMPDTARDPGYGVRALAAEDLMDPVENIRFSADYFGAMMNKFEGDVPLALAAYNAGPGAVMEYGGVPPFEETQEYIEKILGSPGAEVPPGRSYRPVARPDQEAENKSFLDNMPSALAYMDLAGVGQPFEVARVQAPGIRRSNQRRDPLKQLGIASLV